MGATSQLSTDTPRLIQNRSRPSLGSRGLKRLFPKEVGKGRSRARSFVCLLSFIFRTLRGSKIARKEGLSSQQTFSSLSKSSRPRFHILHLPAWILIGLFPYFGPNPCILYKPDKMRAHPLPFSVGLSWQPCPPPWLPQPLELKLSAETPPDPLGGRSSPRLPSAVRSGMAIRTLL